MVSLVLITLRDIVLAEVAIALVLVILLLIIIIWQLLKKYVVVPSLTVIIEKPQYARGDTVNIAGTLKENNVPQGSVTVSITVTDPAGAVTSVTATTDMDGNYTASWVVPDNAPGGSFTVSATALGTTATTTFTLSNKRLN